MTLLPFAESLSDRRAADAVRGRIDWKYLLGLELTDPGFDASVLSGFSAAVCVAGGAEEHLLDTLLALCRDLKLLRAQGRQRGFHACARGGPLPEPSRMRDRDTRAALNASWRAAPEWLRAKSPTRKELSSFSRL